MRRLKVDFALALRVRISWQYTGCSRHGAQATNMGPA
jgi:hypothetical protein